MGGESITDSQKAVGLDGLVEAQAALRNSNRHTADQINDGDEDCSNRVSLDELGSAVHCTVEVSFSPNFFASSSGFSVIDESRIEISVNGHLLARHRVESESRPDFSHALRSLRDHNELNDDEDQEDDKANDD